MDTIDQFTSLVRQSDFLIGAAAGAVLVLLVLLLFKLRRKPKDFEAFSGEQGTVWVSGDALRDLIQRYCEEMPEVGRARAIIRFKGKQLQIQIRLRIRSDARLVGVSGYLQEQIGGIIRQNLGMDNIGPVDVMVVGILPVAQSRSPKKNPPEEEDPESRIRS